MADNKKSVLLYCDLIHTVEKLDNETAGELFKHYLRYINDLNPETDNILVDVVFEPIKQNLKRDLKKWEETKEGKSTSGSLGNLKRWHLDLYNDVILKKKTLEESLIIAKGRTAIKPIANIAVKDTVNVTVKDKVTVKDIIKKENRFNFRKSLVDYGFDKNLVDDWLKVRKTKKASNTETAFKGFIKQVELCKSPINEILTECVNRSWGGLKAEWLNNIKTTNSEKRIKKDAALILQERYGIK